MSIRLKLSLYITALWAMLYLIFHFYWLPILNEQDLSKYRVAQEQALSLMSITLLEAFSREDLAQVYRSINNVMDIRKDWRKLTVLDKNGLTLYPVVSPTIESPDQLQSISWTQIQGGKTFVEFTLLADPQPFLAEQHYVVLQLQWLFFTLFIASLLASIILENKIIRKPIESLIVAIGRLGDRDFSTRLPHASNDEIGKLVGAFEIMRDRIRVHQDQLNSAKDKALKATAVRDEALEATRAKSDFLAKMSHEFRTPLNAIIGYSEIVSESAQEQGHLVYSADISRIKIAAQHLLTLINDILDLAKIEAGKTELFIEEFNLMNFLDEVVDTLRPITTEAHNKLVINYQTSITTVKSDPTKLRQLVFNLLSNANKFTHNGNIDITVGSFNHASGESFTIEIKDNGIGINKQQQARIFMPFAQADDSYTRQHEGIGLGLSLCRQLCILMDGKIEVASVEGQGSTFTITIPVRPLLEQRKQIEIA